MEVKTPHSPYHKGRLMFCYAANALGAEGWQVTELGLHPDDPQRKKCTGQEHKRLPYVGGTTRTYVPSAYFRVTTAHGRVAYCCRECVELLGEAVLARDKGRIAALWNTFLHTIEVEDLGEFEQAAEKGSKQARLRRRIRKENEVGAGATEQ